MNKKRLVLVAFLLLGSSLTNGCSKPNEHVDLTIWHYYNNEQLNALTTLVNEFNTTVGAKENIFIEQESKGYVNDLVTALLDAANGKVGTTGMPDMFMAYSDTAYKLDKMGKVAKLDSYFTKEELDEFNPCFLDEGRFDEENSLKIFPIAKSTELLYINKTDFDAFAAANPNSNITIERLNTIEGVLEMAEIYYNWCGKAFYGRDSLANYFVIGSKQLGIDIFDYDENGNFFVNFDETVFKKLWDYYYVPSIKGYFEAVGGFRSDDLRNGLILCYTGSSSSASFFPKKVNLSEEESHDVECQVSYSPKFKDGQSYMVQQGAGVVVSKSSELKEKAAVTFLKWFTEKEQNIRFATKASYMPVKKDSLTTEFINSIENPALKQSFTIENEMLSSSTLYTNKTCENGDELRNVLEESLENAVENAEEAIAKLVENGTNKEDAINQFISEEHFQTWFEALKKQVNG